MFEDRSRAESFGAVAELYDRARPSYPPQLVAALLQDGPEDVLDVGCGTGIAAALLAAAGCRLLGVEVDARMADVARAKGLEVEVSSFERWDDGGRRFDLIISAQAWHWIEPRAGARKAAEVLRDGGRIGLFWNFGDPPPAVGERVAAIYDRLEPGLENYSVLLGNRQVRAPGRGRQAVAALVESGRFADVQVQEFPWTRAYTTAGWLEHLATHSDHQALADDRREHLLSTVGAALDELGGSFEMAYRTLLVTAQRR